MSQQPVGLMIVAGERSGDLYGGWLASALQSRCSRMALFGCGGESMRSAGVQLVADSNDFAMVGISEVLSGLPRAYGAFQSLVREAVARRPRAAILIDSPSLNMRLARRLKRAGIPVIYFVSPQIWAWKKWRLRQLSGLIDRMLCIFDFEEEIYRKAGIPVDYVGHPLVDAVAPRFSQEEFLSRYNLSTAEQIIALLPGSREIELDYILPPILSAVRRLCERRNLQFVLAAAPALDPARLRARLAQSGDPDRIKIVSETYDALAYSDMAIVASGTATVEAALLARPMVVVYRVSPVTAFFARRMVDVPFFSMVNLLAKSKVVEELIQDDFNAERLAAAASALLDSPDLQSKMKQDLLEVKRRLGGGGAIDRAADIILRTLQLRPAAPEGQNKAFVNTTANPGR